MLPENELLQEGRYRITRLTGQNNAGFIYEGFDNIFEQTAVINQIGGDNGQHLPAGEKILKSIKHESFLHVADYFTEKNTRFIVMETADGEFLNDVLKRSENAQKFSDVMNWTEQILDGLSYLNLHLPNVIYGDLKPQNIIVTAGSGKVKMLASAILRNPQSNKAFGTPSAETLNYSPLEQVWNDLDSASQKVIAGSFDENSERILYQPIDARCDIYSLGVLVYRTLTNQFPKNALERSIELLEGNPDPLVSPLALNAEIPPEISEIIVKALEIKRENRFDSAVIMRQVLRTAFVRIREREAKEARLNEKAETSAPEITFRTVEKSEPNGNQHQETVSDAKENEPHFDESFFGLLESETEADILPDTADAEIENLGLPLADIETEKVAETFVESSDAEVSAAENVSETGETAEQPSAENIEEIKTEKLSGEFFNFDESDENEVLGIELPVEEITPTETISAPVEETEQIISVSEAVKVAPEVVRSDYKKEVSPDEFSGLFENAEVKSRSKMVVPIIVLVLLLVGGGVFAVFMFGSKNDSRTAEQTVSSQPVAAPTVNPVSEPAVENPAQINTATETITTAENGNPTANTNTGNTESATQTETATNPVLTQETTPTARKQAAVKAKPNVEKPQTASAKTPEKPKKKVTVDDLISDY